MWHVVPVFDTSIDINLTFDIISVQYADTVSCRYSMPIPIPHYGIPGRAWHGPVFRAGPGLAGPGKADLKTVMGRAGQGRMF